MKIVITGGIGVGKSTVIEALQGRGIVFSNVDVFVRETYKLPHIIEQLVALYGEDVLTKGDTPEIDRYQLWQKAKDDLTVLERITLPEVEQQLASFHTEHEHETTVVEMPLLFEVEQRHSQYIFAQKFDLIICLHCCPVIQRERVYLRTKALRSYMTDEDIEEWIAEIMYKHQLSHLQRKALTSIYGGVCIDTSGSKEEVRLQVEKIFAVFW